MSNVFGNLCVLPIDKYAVIVPCDVQKHKTTVMYVLKAAVAGPGGWRLGLALVSVASNIRYNELHG